jgi:hypothetical protein
MKRDILQKLYWPILKNFMYNKYMQKIQVAIILICEIPKNLEHMRNKNNVNKNIPPHITMAYLKKEVNYDKIEQELSKFKTINIKFDEICSSDTKVSLLPSSESGINKLCDKIKDYMERKPLNGYHLTVASSKGKWDLYKSEEICKKIDGEIKLPLEVKISDIWILKKEKGRKKVWSVFKKIKLKT